VHDAEVEQQAPAKKQIAADPLDWDDGAGGGDALTSLEQQRETEFACVWLPWMRDGASFRFASGEKVCWGMIEIKGSAFTTEELDDFTHKRSASITKDHVILFTYMNGKTLSPGTIIDGASKELTALFPYNFLGGSEYLVFQTLADKSTITKTQYSPLTRVPIDQCSDTTRRHTSLRPPAGPSNEGMKDTILAVESIANAEHTNRAGEFNGKSFSSLNEEEMGTLNQMVEDHLLKIALKTRGAKEWAEKEIEREKKVITERAELERNDKPSDNEGKLCKQEGLNKYDQKIGLKRSSGKNSIVVAKEEDLDPFEQAYEVMAKEGP
jgi:hypothetical protein